MADRIKGITIELNGDTTKLSKALDGVQKSIKTTSSELKDVNKLLKLDPTNTTLITQKQELLGKAILGTKDKLTTLKTAQEQADAVMAKGGAKTEGYDKLQHEIISTESELKNLEKQAAQTSKTMATLTDVGDKMQTAGAKIKGVGDSLTKGVTAPILGVGAAAIASFKQVDEAMDTVVTKTGASGKALEGMQDSVKKLATTIPVSLQDAGAAVGEVNTRFGLTGTALETLSGQFLKFAQINNTDVSTSVDNVSKVLSAFGLGADKAGSMLDTMNKVGQDTGMNMDELAQSMSQNAAQFQEMGLNASQAAQFLGRVDKSGLDVSAAMMGLKTAMKNATKEGVSTQDAFKAFDATMKSSASESEKLKAAYDTFGAKSGAAFYNAYKTGKLSLDGLNSSMDAFSGNVSKTFEGTLDPLDNYTMAMNSMKLTGAAIAETMMPMIGEALKSVQSAVESVKAAWDSLSPSMQDAIVKSALIAAAIGPIVSIIGTLTTAVGGIISVMAKIGPIISTIITALKALWVVMLANPVTAIIAIIAALVAGFVYLWNTSDSFKKFWIDMWSSMVDTVGGAVVSIGTALSDAWTSISDGVTATWTAISDFIGGIFETIKKTISDAWTSVKDTTVSISTSISDAVTGAWTAVKDTISGLLDEIKQAFIDTWNAIKSFMDGIVDWLKGLFDFQWELPKIKLPHFSISGSFSLDPPSVPYFSVDWYKKAMDNGMILNGATIFGAAGGKLLGGGEAGSEAVVGTDSLQTMISAAVAAAAGNGGDITIPVYIGTEKLDTIIVKANQRQNMRTGGR